MSLLDFFFVFIFLVVSPSRVKKEMLCLFDSAVMTGKRCCLEWERKRGAEEEKAGRKFQEER